MSPYYPCVDCKQPVKPHVMDPACLESRCYDCYMKHHQPSLFGGDSSFATSDDVKKPARGYDR